MFQSHNGAIAAASLFAQSHHADQRFQSHNGAIAAAGTAALVGFTIGFNPTMVRLLRLPVFGGSRIADRRFNPTMVRLLLDDIEHFHIENTSFQSHNGAIAACSIISRSFNYHPVSIPQWCDCCRCLSFPVRTDKRSFNPTMVRLLLDRTSV